MNCKRIVEIVAAPQGNAPRRLRDAWVGCRFPFFQSGPDGYSVDQAIALRVLETRNPKAVLPYREVGYPFGGGGFRFSTDEAMLVDVFE